MAFVYAILYLQIGQIILAEVRATDPKTPPGGRGVVVIAIWPVVLVAWIVEMVRALRKQRTA